MKKLTIAFIVALFFSVSFAVLSGTITFKEKDGTTTSISNAEIISITDGRIFIEKDKKKRAYPLSSIASYYQSDTAGGDNDSMPGEFSDYKVNVMDLKVPEKGVDKDDKTSFAEINYTITKKDPKAKKVKVPYVYLYILTPADEDAGERKIYRYCYPDAAKPKAKGYDEASTLEKVKGFDRPIWNDDERDSRLELKNFGMEKAKIEMKGVKTKKIIAWHLEIWADSAISVEKEWKDIDINSMKRWWEKY